MRFTVCAAAVAVVSMASLAGCGKKIGNECVTSIDCQEEDDTRTCDISQPGGYCTVDGCDEHSCPDGSACIRFFPRLYLTKMCDPAAPTACTADELCLDTGMCAPRLSERRYCALECEDSDDCRDAYECRESGTLGSMALTGEAGARVTFCAPKGS